MKYIKCYENNLNPTEIPSYRVQQPFYLQYDNLYISDEIAKSIVSYGTGTNQNYINYLHKRIKDFFNRTKSESGFYVNQLPTDIFVRYSGNGGYGGYRMDINIRRGNTIDNEFGEFQYFIGGSSGDYEMHGKSMVRSTRECNKNFMIKTYSILTHIKNFDKRMKEGEKILDIIKYAILENPYLAKYDLESPKELENDPDIGHYVSASKYNL